VTFGRRAGLHPSITVEPGMRLYGKRIMLRPLMVSDFAPWTEVRQRNEQWLTPWEPLRVNTTSDPTRHRDAFSSRCATRDRERQVGTGYGFGLFVDNAFAGEINLNSVQRGSFQNAYVGYWIDQAQAGNSYMPESVAVLARFAFDDLRLHRLQVAIIPRNSNSRRVMEKLRFREEGVALRYLEINGAWEDHVRYAITTEEWEDRRAELTQAWL